MGIEPATIAFIVRRCAAVPRHSYKVCDWGSASVGWFAAQGNNYIYIIVRGDVSGGNRGCHLTPAPEPLLPPFSFHINLRTTNLTDVGTTLVILLHQFTFLLTKMCNLFLFSFRIYYGGRRDPMGQRLSVNVMGSILIRFPRSSWQSDAPSTATQHATLSTYMYTATCRI